MPRVTTCQHSASAAPLSDRTFLRTRNASGSWQLHVKAITRTHCTRSRAAFAAAPEHLPSATPTTGGSGSDGGISLSGSRAPTPSLRQDDVVQLRCVSLSFTGEVWRRLHKKASIHPCGTSPRVAAAHVLAGHRVAIPTLVQVFALMHTATSSAERAGGVSLAEEPLYHTQRGTASRF